jgi:hypothetical protein
MCSFNFPQSPFTKYFIGVIRKKSSHSYCNIFAPLENTKTCSDRLVCSLFNSLNLMTEYLIVIAAQHVKTKEFKCRNMYPSANSELVSMCAGSEILLSLIILTADHNS